jgi:basic membrane protein A
MSLSLLLLIVASLALVACGDSTATTAPAATTAAATTAASATTAAGATTAAATGKKFRVAFVYVGSIGDGGWTYAHEQGRKALEKAIPDVQTSYIENVPENPADAERVITELAQKNDMVFTTSFGYMDPTINVAKKFPKVLFEHATGYKTADNVATYQVRQYEPRYLAGIVAGKMTKSNLLGYVAAFPIPEVVDPTIEKTAAQSLLSAGADVLAMHQDTPAVLQAAQDAGKYAFGNDSIMESYAPKAHLASPYWDWGKYYIDRVKAAMAGTWKSGEYFGGYKEGVVELSPLNSVVPADVKSLIDTKRKAIIDGALAPYAGPIKDQSGAIKVPDGQKMSDKDILAIDYLVEGVDGTIPK